MHISLRIGTLVTGAIWTVGGFGASQAVRVATNIILTRLLAPELFGLMVIVNTLRTGVELFSDIGISQNIVYSHRADDPSFYNTAWTLRIIRSVGMFFMLVIIAIPTARFYDFPTLAYILPFTGMALLILGFEFDQSAFATKEDAVCRIKSVRSSCRVYRIDCSDRVCLFKSEYMGARLWGSN